MFIPEEKYKEICESVIIVCVDVVVRYENKFLLIKRNEEPMKGVLLACRWSNIHW